AVAEAGDVEGALALVERLELDRYHYLHAARAELLRRLGRVEDARAAYDRALEFVHSDSERRFLERRLADLGARGRVFENHDTSRTMSNEQEDLVRRFTEDAWVDQDLSIALACAHPEIEIDWSTSLSPFKD